MLFAMACIVVIVGGLKLASGLLVPVMLAFFLAVISLPILRALRERGVPRFPAVLLTVVVDIGILSPIAFVATNLIAEFQAKYPTYKVQMAVKFTEFEQWVETSFDYKMRIDPDKVLAGVNEAVLNFVGGAAEFMKDFTFILIIMIFFLAEAGGFTRKMGAIRGARGPDLERLAGTATDVQKYLGIKTLVSAFTGLLAALLTWKLGLNFALLWGMLAFTFNYIPAIGSIIASVPPTMLALVDKTPGTALVVLLGYLAINMILGNFIEPMLLGRRFGISTSVVVLSVVFWGWLWGLAGMFLAVPLTMLLKVMLDNSEDFRWLSIALGKHDGFDDEPAAPPPVD
jgi:AI-2 transport protein TqsA